MKYLLILTILSSCAGPYKANESYIKKAKKGKSINSQSLKLMK